MAKVFKGFSITGPINRLGAGIASIALNVRQYARGIVSPRNLLTAAIETLAAALHSLRRLNDSTPNGPVSGYTLISGAGTVLYSGSTSVVTGLTGNPVSMIPFRPNASVQPWMYIGDSAAQDAVTLNTNYLGANSFGPAGASVAFLSNGMMKVRSDGTVYKMGVKEPQLAPIVSTASTNAAVTGTLLASAVPWTNYTGQNFGYNYGQTTQPLPSTSITPPFIINVANANTLTFTFLSGTATVNGGSHAPTDTSATWVGATYPGQFVQVGGVSATTASVLVGAFTDGSGNVVPLGQAPLWVTSVIDVGKKLNVAIPVPYGAQQFQLGINSAGNSFLSNSGSYSIAATVTTNALPTVTSILGTLAAYYWDDSPTSGPTSAYIWKNPDDPGGSGPTRSTSDAIGSTTGNSFIFDATFTAGIPSTPGIGDDTVPMLWTDLSPESVAIGSNPLFSAPLIKTDPNNTTYRNFNFCLTGSIYFPSGGNFTLVLTNHDDCIWGIGGGVTLVSATATGSGEGVGTSISGQGQTITVVGGYALLPRQTYTTGLASDYAQTSVIVSVPAAGIYPIEIDDDYWFHSGRILLLEGSPTAGAAVTIIPPLPANVRQQVQYRYVYRSSATGAESNPSPESTAIAIPVTSNTVTSYWSNDPQIDVVDYYRIDSVTASFTYVATGPNDNNGAGGTNTAITDSLLDTELGTQLLNYDNFEPVPSIDLPQKGTCSVSGGVITWISGGAIGGSATGFNPRWLAGTNILIGSPTSLSYTMIARPSLTTISSGTASSSTSTGTSFGGGVAWTNPGNIDSSSSFATVSLSSGATPYTPSTTTGSATATIASGQTPQTQVASTTIGSFSSTAATSATINVQISAAITLGTSATGYVILQYSTDSGATFHFAKGISNGPSTLVQIPVSGITNLNTLMIQIECSVTTTAYTTTSTASGFVTNWYVVLGGGGAQPTAQTLQAAITGWTLPAGLTITGLVLSFNAEYSGVAPTFSLALNVGTEIDTYTLTTSPATYSSGSSTDLWGYSSWTAATLSSLLVDINASSTGTTTVSVNTLKLTVYYTQLVSIPNITIPGVPNANSVAYEISEPILGAQPLSHLMGPTDNINFVFAWGDKLRPGTLYWCEGNNFDSWPDTNQMDVTDPGEALVGGDIAGAFGVIGSIKRWWIIVPNFFNALATVTGTEGSTWTLQKTSIDRGLFMEWCVAVEGDRFFFRVNDGIHFSNRGSGSQSITDDTLYPLFPHEGSVPVAVTVNGVTVYPPDDTQPQLQKFKIITGRLYYDYVDTTNVPRTLVFDTEAMGWIWDVYQWPATVHAANQGFSQQGTLVGCNDGSVRLMSSAGTETGTFTVQTGAVGGRGYMHMGGLVVEYSAPSPITLNCYAADSGNGSYGPSTITLPTQSTLTKYWIRPTANKWKLLVFNFSSTASFQLNVEGCVAYLKAWGSDGEYAPIGMLDEQGGGG